MITVKAYLYPVTAEVQVFDPSIFTVRYRVMYSRPIKVYQGIATTIQVLVRNQDQKKVDLTGSSMEAAIQDPTNQVTINTYAVTWSNIAAGQGTVTLDETTINSLEQRFYKLTFKVTNANTAVESPVYVDSNYGVPLDLEILPAYYSSQESTPEFNYSVIDGGNL